MNEGEDPREPSPLSGVSVAPADAALFEEFEECVRRSGVRIHYCRPGLSDDEIDSLMAPTGLRLPDEVRAFWRWHDGFYPLPGMLSSGSLADTVSHCAMLLSVAESAAAHMPEELAANWWRPEWFPLTTDNITPVCDCSVGAGEPSPIRRVSPTGEENQAIYTVSLGQLVRWMIVAIERGWVAPHEAGEFVEGPGLAETYDLPEYSSLCMFI